MNAFRKLGIAATLGTMIMAGGLSGCGMLSRDHVDCKVVKLQAESGRSDAEIASAMNGSAADVTACREKSGSAASGTSVPSAY